MKEIDKYFDTKPWGKFVKIVLDDSRSYQNEEKPQTFCIETKGNDKVYAINKRTKTITPCKIMCIKVGDNTTVDVSFDNKMCDNSDSCMGCPFHSWYRNVPDDDYSCKAEDEYYTFSLKNFGETVFNTLQEAEAALNNNSIM